MVSSAAHGELTGYYRWRGTRAVLKHRVNFWRPCIKPALNVGRMSPILIFFQSMPSNVEPYRKTRYVVQEPLNLITRPIGVFNLTLDRPLNSSSRMSSRQIYNAWFRAPSVMALAVFLLLLLTADGQSVEVNLPMCSIRCVDYKLRCSWSQVLVGDYHSDLW